MRLFKVLLCCCLAWATLEVAYAQKGLPQSIPVSTMPQLKVWLSAQAFAASSGKAEPLEALLPSRAAIDYAERHRPSFARTQAALAARAFDLVSSSICQEFLLPAEGERSRSNAKLVDLAKNASAVFEAEVDATSAGFVDGIPETLLSVRPLRWFRRDARLAQTAFLVPYPVARFHLGDRLYCTGAPNRTIPVPRAKLVVFVFEEAITEYVPLLDVKASELILRKGRDSMEMEEGLTRDETLTAARSFSGLLEMLPRLTENRAKDSR